MPSWNGISFRNGLFGLARYRVLARRPRLIDDVDPFPVGGPVDDRKGATGGDALGFVAGAGVAVVGVTLREIPGGQIPGFGGAVEANRQAGAGLVDGGDRARVTVEHPEPALVPVAQDPVPGLKQVVPRLEGGAGEPPRSGGVDAGPLVVGLTRERAAAE